MCAVRVLPSWRCSGCSVRMLHAPALPSVIEGKRRGSSYAFRKPKEDGYYSAKVGRTWFSFENSTSRTYKRCCGARKCVSPE